MDWARARRLWLRADGREDRALLWDADPFATPALSACLEPLRDPAGPRAHSLCVASGKGGTGKTVVCASLAALFALRGRTLIVDADLGVGNAHILQDVSPRMSVVEVAEGRLGVRDVLQPCGPQLDLLPGGSGVSRMAELAPEELARIAHGLERVEHDYRFLLSDSAAGLSPQTMAFASASELVLLVTTPDLTAMTDAYAFLKVLHARSPRARVALVVNRATDEQEARGVAQRLCAVSRRFLEHEPICLGWLPEDRAVVRSVNLRRSVVLAEPGAPVSAALRALALSVLELWERESPRGLGSALLDEIQRH